MLVYVKYSLVFSVAIIVFLRKKIKNMDANDKQLLKNTPSMIKVIAVQVEHLNNRNNLSLSLNDVCGMAEFALALGCQISEAEKVNTVKLVSECLIGGVLFSIFIVLLAANMANR